MCHSKCVSCEMCLMTHTSVCHVRCVACEAPCCPAALCVLRVRERGVERLLSCESTSGVSLLQVLVYFRS